MLLQALIFIIHYTGVVSVCFERQTTGEIRVLAYPRQDIGGGSVLAKQTLKASTGFSVTSQDEERISAGKDE